MSGDNSPGLARRVGRAFRRTCPHCGGPAFDSYFTMKERCDRCELKFEREPGYWVGATIINTTVIFATFLIVFLVGIVVTWPDVPWAGLLITLAVVNIGIPITFYPMSKTLWLALEMGWNPIKPDDTAAIDDPGGLQGR